MVVAHPARLGTGVWRALPVLPTSRWTSLRPSHLPSLCTPERDSPLQVMSAQVKMGRFLHKRCSSAEQRQEFPSPCYLEKDSHTQVVQALIARLAELETYLKVWLN